MRLALIRNGFFFVALLLIGEASVGVGEGIIPVDFYGVGGVGDGAVIVDPSGAGKASDGRGAGLMRIEGDGSGGVGDGAVTLSLVEADGLAAVAGVTPKRSRPAFAVSFEGSISSAFL